MILQLNPTIPVKTPKGNALAHFIIDSGIENDLQWVCIQDFTGECWTWKNPQIRSQINITQGRDYISPFYDPSNVAFSQNKEDNDETIQKQNELSTEHQESSKEEDYEDDDESEDSFYDDESEDSFYSDYINEKNKNEILEEKLKSFKEYKKTSEMFDEIKFFVFDLQDFLIKLLNLRKISSDEIQSTIDILCNTGVKRSDIRILCSLDNANESKELY